MALLEYENCLILNENLQDEFGDRIERLKSFIYPEERIIRVCLEKGGVLHGNGDFKTANKYFSKVMLMANRNSTEYKQARGKYMVLD